MTPAAQGTIRHGLVTQGWLPAAALIATTALVGPYLGNAARPIFLSSCVVAAWYAWARSPGSHLQAVLVLFSFTPYVRRLIDVTVGFDGSGLMIAGPLLALLVPLPGLQVLLCPGRKFNQDLVPFFVFGACIAYCIVLTLGRGEWSQAATGALKWSPPLLYAIAVYESGSNAAQLARRAAGAFAVILPITGLYGIYQYIDPPMHDRYWLMKAAINSAGEPLPYEVRTFSTMHGPAAFATYTAAGLLLVYILRQGWLSRLAMAPAVVALGLSTSRAPWIALGVGVLLCLLFSKTRAKAAGAFALLVVTIAVSLVYAPFTDVIVERASTFGNASNDYSAQERMAEFSTLWGERDSRIFGAGFDAIDTATAGAAATDGMFVACWTSMGIIVGLICVFCVIWIIGRALICAIQSREQEGIALGALLVGWLIQVPLATVAAGELGFLFWITAALAIRHRPRGVRW